MDPNSDPKIGPKIDPKIIEAIKNRTPLIVGSAGESRARLTAVFEGLNCQPIFAHDDVEARAAVRSGRKFDLILFEAQSPIDKYFKFIRELRTLVLEPPPLFMVTDKVDAHFDTAFYEGLEAIFVQPIQPDDLVSGIAFSYSTLLGHASRKHERKQVQRAKVAFALDGQQIEGYSTNISMGGLFVGGTAQMPAKSQHLKLKLTFEGKGHMTVIGIGIVRWIRPEMEFGRPRGFGVEFIGLDSQSRTVLQDLLGLTPAPLADPPLSLAGRRPK